MPITVFTWDMFSFKRSFGVGHASMHVTGSAGSAYISFWPTAHNPAAATYSQGQIHFMRGDKDSDGQPSWVSKPLTNLDEKAIISFWKQFDLFPSLDYREEQSANVTKSAEDGRFYNILWSQCSTTVVLALWHGADFSTRARLTTWLTLNAGRDIDLPLVGLIKLPLFPRIPTVTPADVREMVTDIWGD